MTNKGLLYLFSFFLFAERFAWSLDWSSLQSKLSSPDIFGETNLDEFIDQCAVPFDLARGTNFQKDDGSYWEVSNYQLIEQSSGLCMDTLDCAYDECKGPLMDGYEGTAYAFYHYISSPIPAVPGAPIVTDDQLKASDALNLPAAVVHPQHVGDVSEAVKFALQNDLTVSVKTSGHSWAGSSTVKDSLLLNLRQLPKYSPHGSLKECQFESDLEGAFEDACKLAIARDKPAILRVGGGEIWGEVLEAVFVDWNENEDNKRKYHVMSGFAGTVSAAGGWLASGGLAAFGMRKYGVGSDQVLHVEMVLPDSRHVRFGPSSWEKKLGNLYPVTKDVTGYCNEGDLTDEESWVWKECTEEPNFADLWYAVRGGGGGTYGVITSIYYQLHDPPFPLQFITWGRDVTVAYTNEDDPVKQEILSKTFQEFYLRFLYFPESVGVSESASNYCSSPDAHILGCFGGAGDVFVAAWKRFSNNLFEVDVQEYDNPYKFMLPGAQLNPNHPNDRIPDDPLASARNFLRGDRFVVPLDVIKNRLDEFLDLVHEITLRGFLFAPYNTGGEILRASDGMTAYPMHRRQGAFMMSTYGEEDLANAFLELFELEDSVDDKEEYPGVLCHNHISFFTNRPRKDDWTKFCTELSPHLGEDDECYSMQESAFGTKNLRKLESIHSEIDPNHIFNCGGCVGYEDDSDVYVPRGKKKTKKSGAMGSGKKRNRN